MCFYSCANGAEINAEQAATVGPYCNRLRKTGRIVNDGNYAADSNTCNSKYERTTLCDVQQPHVKYTMPARDQPAATESVAKSNAKKPSMPLAPNYAQLQSRIALNLSRLDHRFAKVSPKPASADNDAGKSPPSLVDEAITSATSSSGFSSLSRSAAAPRSLADSAGGRIADGAIQDRTAAALSRKDAAPAKSKSLREMQDEEAALLAEELPPNAGIGSLATEGKHNKGLGGGHALSPEDEILRRKLLGRRASNAPWTEGREQTRNAFRDGTGGMNGKDGVGGKKKGRIAREESESEEEEGRSALGRKKRRRDG
jgi:hypothetical protein